MGLWSPLNLTQYSKNQQVTTTSLPPRQLYEYSVQCHCSHSPAHRPRPSSAIYSYFPPEYFRQAAPGLVVKGFFRSFAWPIPSTSPLSSLFSSYAGYVRLLDALIALTNTTPLQGLYCPARLALSGMRTPYSLHTPTLSITFSSHQPLYMWATPCSPSVSGHPFSLISKVHPFTFNSPMARTPMVKRTAKKCHLARSLESNLRLRCH